MLGSALTGFGCPLEAHGVRLLVVEDEQVGAFTPDVFLAVSCPPIRPVQIVAARGV